MTEKRFMDGGEECVEDQFLIDTETDTNYWIDNGLDEIVDLLNEQHEQIQTLKRHIERNTISKIRVEDVLDCAKYDRFYNNKEAIKVIDCIAKDLGIDLE